MENLLLENPTMSVYSKQHQNDEENSKELQNKQLLPYDTSKMQLVPVNNNNKQLVLYNNKAKLELADKMGIPLTSKETKPPEKVEETHPKTTKKSLKKHNTNMIKVVRGKKSFKIHQCGLKAGRRRN
jgi:secreted PhoX family phosphatase